MGVVSKKRVLITGIGGFTGRHLEKKLVQEGYQVYGTCFSTPKLKGHFKCDILNKEELKTTIKEIMPTYIVHLAAISFVATKNISLIYETNVIGTLNVLEAIEELGINVSKVLIASSAAVYGNIGSHLTEEMCPKPVNHYGNSKLVMENMIAGYFNKYEIIITRPFNYTGVGQEQRFLVPKIVYHFQQKLNKIELGNTNTFREYNDVAYLTEAYTMLLTSSFSSGVLNISSGQTYSINDILQLMEEISGHSMDVKINPKFVRKNEIKELKGSNLKLKEVLKRDIELAPLKDTLSEMYFHNSPA